jgi:hypothetical protein
MEFPHMDAYGKARKQVDLRPTGYFTLSMPNWKLTRPTYFYSIFARPSETGHLESLPVNPCLNPIDC